MEVIDLLTATRDKTVAYFELPPQALLHNYAPGSWTVQEILVHLADAESVLHERIKRIIAEPGKVVWAFDQDNWCSILDYKNFPLEISKTLYMANRQSVIFLAEKFYALLGSKTFVHSETGTRTLQNEFDKVALHNSGHLVQIEKALNAGINKI